jgi:hypothetical protein
LKTSARFRRSGTLDRTVVATSGNIRFFTAARGGTEITFNGTDNVFTGTQLTAGVRVFAQADSASGGLNDVQLTLTLAAGPGAGAPVSVSLTAVSLVLDISASRPSPGVAPPPLPQPPAVTPPAGTATDKWFGGRLLSAQDTGTNSQERALLTVGPILPAAFVGVLLLRQVRVSGTTIGAPDSKVQVFTNESPTPGETAKNNPHEIDMAVTPIPPGGLQFFVQGRTVSAGLRDTGFQLGIKAVENDGDRVAITVGVASVITLPAQTARTQKVIVVGKTYTSPARQAVTLRTGTAFARSGTLSRDSSVAVPTVRLFSTAAGGAPLNFDGTDNVFTGAQLTAGVQLFADAVSFSPFLDDFQLTLTLTAGAGPPAGLPAKAKMTAVTLNLDISMSRTSDLVDPNPLPQPPAVAPAVGAIANDKWFGGRFVHLQDPGRHHGRALLVVRPIQPAAFNETLVLRQVTVSPANAITGLDTRLQVFDNEFRPAAGELAKNNPHEINTATTPIPGAGLQFFVEGANVSGAVRDTGFQLGIKDFELDGDRVALTVVRFSNLQAEVPSTSPRTPRLGNGPVPACRFRRGTGAAPASADFDTDFTANPPLVLINGALPAGSPVQLSVAVAPAGVPVSWSVLRDPRTAANGGDHPSVVALSPNAKPTRTVNVGNPLLATLLDDAVGSFHIQPFVDCNGSNSFDDTRNKEPFITMNLVLIRVGGSIGATNSTNTSVAQPGNIVLTPAAGAATSATGVGFSSGGFANPAGAGVNNIGTIVVVGGGPTGQRGLDNLFAGWINNVAALNIVATYRDLVTGAGPTHTSIFATNRPGAPPALGLFLPPGVAPPAGLPAANVSNAAPTITPFPLLDTAFRPNSGTGGNTAVGTESVAVVGPPPPPAALPHRGILRTPLAVGQTWRVQMWDSPGFPCFPNHFAFPGRLISFQNDIDFQIDLCFWTNINVPAVPGPTPGPITGAPPPTPDAACCSYATVQTNAWQIRFRMNFPVPAGPPPLPPSVGVVTTRTITMNRDANALRLARPVAATAEVRLPIALNLFAVDAQH